MQRSDRLAACDRFVRRPCGGSSTLIERYHKAQRAVVPLDAIAQQGKELTG
ncbi:hypothetical protein EV192_10243 [Actinocrispum wychmicini]|uniref:Uncharacterized protein n=1 Tax=Actinocrispum wychmicini TaxID=1213861 RepID=A0A4R2JX46_9PSEU|nr:hypothetical protein EV192_10243 [Actinocrispum wychmicini]